MGKKQDVNTENNAVEGNSADADSKICKNEGKRRQVGDKKRSKNCHVCEVRLLDGTELAIEIEVCYMIFIVIFVVFIDHFISDDGRLY